MIESNENDFSYQNLHELSHLDEHIDFVEELLNKYDWDKNTKKDFNTKLKQIKKKQNDNLLNISVIGEFSTGKSTFINALLRTELLSSDVLQGTTVASTIISYSKHYNIIVSYKNGDIQGMRLNNLKELKDQLIEYTTNPDKAKGIETVKVYLPAEQLKDKYRIIDTPGTNALEAWHTDVTTRTLHDISDVSLILTGADKQFPETFCSFIENNISDILPQCVFIITKIDTIPPKERKRVYQYSKLKIRNRFDICDPIVFTYSSLDVISYSKNDNPVFENENSNLLKESLMNEQKIFEYTGKTRVVAQIKKIMAMTDNIYDLISPKIEEMKNSHESNLKQLRNSKQADLKDFVEKQISERVNNFKDQVNGLKYKLKSQIDNDISNYCRYIYENIRSRDTTDNILKYIENNMSYDVRSYSDSLTSNSTNIFNNIFEIYKSELNIFCKCFEKYFRDMDLLKMKFDGKNYIQPTSPVISSSDFCAAANAVSEKIKEENRVMLGGAAAGAAIGTAIMPGLGSLIGGFIGGVVGATKINIDEVRNIAVNKTSGPLNAHFDNIRNQTIDSVSNYVDILSDQIEIEINNYLYCYKEEVDKRIATEKKIEKTIQCKINIMLSNMNEINERKEKMNSFRNLMNQLHNVEYIDMNS